MENRNALAQFVTHLIYNPTERKAFLEDREEAISNSSLGDDEKTILRADRLSMLIDWLDPDDDRPTPERQTGGGSGSGSGGSGGSGG